MIIVTLCVCVCVELLEKRFIGYIVVGFWLSAVLVF